MRFIDYSSMSDDDILNLGESAGNAPRHEADRYPPVDHWVTIDHRHIPITESQGRRHVPIPSRQAKCPPQKKAFFDALGGIFKAMGKAADTDPDFIAALSAYESGWLGQHAQGLHNPFGLTKAGGKNLSLRSYGAAASYWLYHAGRDRKGYARVVSGAKTIEAFLAALRTGGYNAATKNWAAKIAELRRTSILPFKSACGF